MNFNLGQVMADARRVMASVGNNTLTAAVDANGLTPTGALVVSWNTYAGGTVNPSTGASPGATELTLSGTLTGIAVEEGAKAAVRQFSEIQVGDLIVTLTANPQVTLYAGQPVSGTVSLDSLATQGPFYTWNNVRYSQAPVSTGLQAIWTESVAGVAICKGILLRRTT